MRVYIGAKGGNNRISRRTMLKGMGAGAAVAAMTTQMGTAWADQTMRRQAGLLNLGSLPDPSKPAGADLLPQIQNIVIYMNENHSFDNYFGTLVRPDGVAVDGFTMGPDGLPANSNPDLLGNPFTVTHKELDCDDVPGTSQSWNASHISWNKGAMDGFIRAGGSTSGQGSVGAMSYYTKDDLPFYHGLASTFPICDKWFCSVLGQTFPNRRYLQAATSVGIVSTDVAEVLNFPDAPQGIIWDRLNDNGITWLDYSLNNQDLADILLFPNFYGANNTSHRSTFDKFLYDATAGTLPQVSIISPGGTSYSEERPNDVQLGEAYSSSIINAVMHGPQWPNTAMFFMYDEHGGYYDHVSPPPAVAPDDILPHITAHVDQPGAFDQYGIRVPGFVISPFAKPNYVSHQVHDHTSVLKFIETKWNLAPMTYRDAAADDLLDSFDFASPGFMDPPELPASGVPATGSTCSAVPLPATVSSITPPPTTSTTTSTTSTTTTSSSTTSTTVAPTTTTPTGATSVPPTSTLSSVPAKSLGGLAAALSAAEREPTVRFGSDTGDGAPTGPLPTTGSPTDRLGGVGAVAAVGGAALVLAAREANRRARAGVDLQTPNQ